MNAARSARGSLLAGIGGVVLIAALFLSWYSATVSGNGTSVTVTVDAWRALSSARWILLLLGLSTVGLSAVVTVPRLLPTMERGAIARALTAIGIAAALVVLYRLIEIPTGGVQVPPDVHLSRSVGAYVALLAALAMLAGALMNRRSQGLGAGMRRSVALQSAEGRRVGRGV